MKKLYSLLFIFFISSFLFSLLASPASAALGDILNSPDMSQEKYVIGNTTQSGILDSINNGYTCALSGCYDSKGELAKGGIIPVMGQTITAFYRYPPASSAEYFADVLENMGLPGSNKVLAQGTGYTMLSPFLPIWKAFRNMAYSLYIIIFVVIGIMIMLRTKVNAQTIISIQTALPNLLITLILITFSYAIAGFLIDLMYFSIYLIVYLADFNGLIDAKKAIPRLLTHNAWTVVFSGRNALVEKTADAISGAFWGITTTNTIWEKILGGVTFSFGYLIIACAIAIQMLKLIWTLAKSYIMLIIQTITSPLQILMNAMPGSKAFSGWLKKTASYLAPFPIVAVMFVFAAILAGPAQERWWTFKDKSLAIPIEEQEKEYAENPFGVTSRIDETSTFNLPPFVGLRDSAGALTTEDILGIIALCVILMTPAAAKMAQDALQTKESPYTSEIGAGISAGRAIAGYPMGQIKQARSLQEQKRIQEYGATRYAEKMKEVRDVKQGSQATENKV